MKSPLVVIFSSLALSSLAQLPPLAWSSPIQIADGSMYGNINPSITLTDGSVPVVMWGKATGELFVSRLQGSTFSTPVRITPLGMQVFSSDWAAPNIASFGNVVYSAFKEKPEMMGNLYFVRSTDGGLTFSDTIFVHGNWSRFAAISAREDGNPLVTFMEFDSGFVNPHHVLSYSIDGGSTFDPPRDATALSPGEVCDCCQGMVLSSSGRDVVIFRNNDANIRDMWVSMTDNSGSSFSETDIDESDWFNVSCPGSGPGAIMTSDSVIAAWMSAASGQSRVIVGTISLDDMQPGMNLMRAGLSGSPNQDNPALAGSGDTIALFWEEIAGGNRDVFMSYSLNGAAGLNDTAINVSSAPGTQLDIDAVYEGGVFHIVYMDNVSGDAWYRTASLPGISGTPSLSAEPLSFFPNPASDLISVEAENLICLSLLDATGRELITSTSNRIDVSLLPSAIYIIRAESADSVRVGKMVKQ